MDGGMGVDSSGEKRKNRSRGENIMKMKAIVVLMTLGLLGCGSNSKTDLKSPPPTPPVKPAPAYTPEALDPALRERARQELLAETNSPDPFLRSNAIEALSEVDTADAPAAILKGMKDPDSPVRFAAAMAAGKLKLVDAYRPLREMAYDPDLRVQAAVRYALHRLGDTRLSHDLERFAGSPDSHLRGTTAMVLGLLGEPSATKMLTTLDSDPAPSVRIQ